MPSEEGGEEVRASRKTASEQMTPPMPSAGTMSTSAFSSPNNAALNLPSATAPRAPGVAGESNGAKPVKQRIRPGILSRQASEREDGEVTGYLQSASEDDDARHSDTGSLPQRFTSHPSSAASSIRKTIPRHSPLSTPSASNSLHSGNQSHSGGEASASSSRSHLPLQSKTSLYRRQASAGSNAGMDWSEDGGASVGGITFGSDNLSRAKSVSSVSSVNSTSSMEAVPFRAAPLGNVRVGYGGYGKAKAGSGGAREAGVGQAEQGQRNGMLRGDSPRSAQRDPQPSQRTAALDSSALTPAAGRQRVLPKGPSDDWHFRNAPGMGPKSGSRGTLGTFHTIGTTRSTEHPALSGAFAHQEGSEGIGEGGSSMLLSTGRTKPSIRSKLAKRAGKLGLKPLTNVVAGVSPTSSSLHTIAARAHDQMQSPSSVDSRDSVTSPPLSVAARLSPEAAFRSGKSYFANATTMSSNILTNFSYEGEGMTKTSSVTNAPLVVAKHPPGPPRSGPSPSPGLTGPPSPYYPFGLASPKVSPRRMDEALDPLEGAGEGLAADAEVEEGNGGNEGKRPAFGRVGSRGSLNGLMGAMKLGEASPRQSLSLPGRSSSPGIFRSSTPPITPAQQIQLDVKAGLARAPAEPSGATPGPNPALDYGAAMPDEDALDDEHGLSPVTVTRPASTSFSTQPTAKPGQGRGQVHRLSISSSQQKRPGLLRAMTSDSLVARRSAHGEDIRPTAKGIAVDESTGVSNYWSGRPMRSGSSSPKSSSLSSSSNNGKEAAADRSSPLRLDIPPGGLAPLTTTRSRANSAARAYDPSPSSQVTGDMTITDRSMSEHTAVAGGGSPEKGVNPLPPIDESHLSSDGAQGDEKAGTALPSLAVSSASASMAPASIRHPTPEPTPGAFLPRPEMSLPLQTGTGEHALNAATPTGTAALDPGKLISSDGGERPRAGSVGRTTRVESDFQFGDILGEGSYSTVMEAWDLKPLREEGGCGGKGRRDDKVENGALGAMVGKRLSARQRANVEGAKVYAVKVLDKVHILKEKKQKYVSIEKEALSLLIRHPGVITLYWTFQNRDSLYFVLELAPNGELLNFIKKLGSFDAQCTRYYGAQLLDTIEGMHQMGVLHRDLKPENVLLDAEMKIRVADFGSAKIFKRAEQELAEKEQDGVASQATRQRSSSFVGTAEYVSPELLTDKQVSEASDWWAFGCLLFQMMCGKPPFKGASEYQTFQKIMKREFEYPDELGVEARDLIDAIMVLDPDQRLKPDQIRAHRFFHGLDWQTVWKAEAPELVAGIYKRPIAAQKPPSRRSSDGYGSNDTRMFSQSEDDDGSSRPDARSLGDSAASMQQADEQSIGVGEGVEGRDADDDDSSFSDSNSPLPRRRGFSAGASAAERMLAAGSSTSSGGGSGAGKRPNHFFRMTPGLSLPESKGDDGSAGGSLDAPLKVRPSSRSKAVRNQASSRLSGSVGPPAPEAKRSLHAHSKTASNANSHFYSSLATSWAALLLPNESLLYSCPILHKTTGALLRSSTKKRQLLLTDFPRLLCVKETNDQLRVKSEVILGLPQLSSAGMPSRPHEHDGDEDDEEDDDDDEEEEREAVGYRGHAGPQMKRQSSAGPLLASPTRGNHGSTGSTGRPIDSPDLSGTSAMNAKRRAIERRESFPFSLRQGSGTTNAGAGNAGSTRLQLVTSSNSAASLVDASPNIMTAIEQKSIRTFMVTTPAKSFLYEDPSGDATHWVKSIALAAARRGNTNIA